MRRSLLFVLILSLLAAALPSAASPGQRETPGGRDTPGAGAGGFVSAWGHNRYGQLGTTNNGNDSPNPTPTEVRTLSGLTAIAAGSAHSLALKVDGTVWAWGYNSYGQLGSATNSGTNNPNPTPTQVGTLTGVTAVAAGQFHGLALKSDGTVWAWGQNEYGQLGSATNSGATYPNPTPKEVSGLGGVTAIAAGGYHSLALKSDGTVWAWGHNQSGQLGNPTNNGTDNDNPTPTQVSAFTGVVAIAAGGYHSLALKGDGTVWALGNNYFGQLGTTTNSGTDTPNPVPTQVGTLTGVIAIAAGGIHGLALKSDGTVWAWGNNLYGQLGNTTNSGTLNPNPTPTEVSALTGIIAIAAGGYHGLALKSDGTVWAWGSNLYGQLGNTTTSGTNNANPTPKQVSALTGVIAIAAGGNHSLAVRVVNQEQAWGWNRHGQLGNTTNNGTDNPNPTPTQVSGLSGLTATDGGLEHSLGLKSDGTVWAWGNNLYGQLGNTTTSGTNNANPTPKLVSALTGVIAIAAGSNHSLALKSDGTVWAWGDNFYGQLGNPTNNGTSSPDPTPTEVSGLSGVSAVAAGHGHNLALKSDGTVWAWGANYYGQLGNPTNSGTTSSNPTPLQVSGLSGVTAIAAGWMHSLALKSDGTVWAWGWNRYGQLGTTTNSGNDTPNPTPTEVSGLSGVGAVAAGHGHSLALKSDGTVWGWGHNVNGQLGNTTNSGTLNPDPTPLQVSGLSDVIAIAAGGNHSLALKSDGTMRAWGDNSLGQLGNPTNSGTNNPNPTPTQVSALTGVTAIAAGSNHSLALLDLFTSSVELTSSPNPSAEGQQVTFTANVSAVSPATGTPTGSVTFKDGTTTLGTAPLNAGGVATLSTSSLSAGAHTITAEYSGDSSFHGSSATHTHTVNAPTSTPTASPTESATAAATASSTATATGTATATAINTPTSTATAANTPTSTSTATATPTSTATPSNTPASTSTATASGTAPSMATGTPPATSTTTNTPASTSTAAATRTVTGTPPPTSTATATNTPASTSTATSTSASTPAATATFTQHFIDVPPGETFFVFVERLHDLGIVSGYADNTFRPYNPITRGQIAKIVAISAGFNEAPGPQIFADVPAGHTFYDYINRLANRGIVAGYPCPTLANAPQGEEPCTPEKPRLFRPERNATRGQLAKIVSNAAGYDEPVSGQFYADVPPTGEGSQFYEWIMRLTSRGVIGGYSCGGPGLPCDAQNRPYFRPSIDVTRGEAAKIVANTFFP